MNESQTVINALNLINTLPIELWNIILSLSIHTNAKGFIYVVMLHKIFTLDELEELKKKYIYDYLISSSPLTKQIYNIYNNIGTIDTKIKYITNYNHVFQMMCTLEHEYIINSIILKTYLLKKKTNKKDKVKFERITYRIYDDHSAFNNRHYTKMLKHL